MRSDAAMVDNTIATMVMMILREVEVEATARLTNHSMTG
jgi:hypothetical protein